MNDAMDDAKDDARDGSRRQVCPHFSDHTAAGNIIYFTFSIYFAFSRILNGNTWGRSWVLHPRQVLLLKNTPGLVQGGNERKAAQA